MMKKRVLALVLAAALCLCLAVPAAAANKKLIALTFDDGPDGTNTSLLLDGLAARNVKATFFFLGCNAENYPDVVRRAYDEGHQVASHTYSHTYFNSGSSGKLVNEVEQTRSLLESLTGQKDFMVRLPGGNGTFSSGVGGRVAAPVIYWSVDTRDWADKNASTVRSRIIDGAGDGEIILLHCIYKTSVDGALSAIDYLLQKGYEFVTVEELFRLRGINARNGVGYRNAYRDGDATYYDESRGNLKNHWAYSSISHMTSRGYMDGDGAGDGTWFSPNGTLTRAQAATILWRVAGKPRAASACPFTDVKRGTWYTDAIDWAYEKGITDGVTSREYRPSEQVTREQFYKLSCAAASAMGKVMSTRDGLPAYSDIVRIDDYALPYLHKIWKAGFRSKNDVELFRATDTMTRAEAAELAAWVDGLRSA